MVWPMNDIYREREGKKEWDREGERELRWCISWEPFETVTALSNELIGNREKKKERRKEIARRGYIWVYLCLGEWVRETGPLFPIQARFISNTYSGYATRIVLPGLLVKRQKPHKRNPVTHLFKPIITFLRLVKKKTTTKKPGEMIKLLKDKAKTSIQTAKNASTCLDISSHAFSLSYPTTERITGGFGGVLVEHPPGVYRHALSCCCFPIPAVQQMVQATIC